MYNMKKSTRDTTLGTLIEKAEILDLLMKDIQEVGFVLQAKDYKEYLSTYTEIGLSTNNAVFTEKQFNKIRGYVWRRKHDKNN